MLLVIFYFLLLPVLWFSPKHRHHLIIILLLFYALYDLVDYSTIYFGVSILVKLLPEIFLFGFIILYLLQHVWHKKHYDYNKIFFLTIVVLITLFSLSLHDRLFIKELYEFRLIFRPILFSIFILETCHFSDQQFTLVLRMFMLVLAVICLVGIYQYCTFDGNFTAVWRYEPLLNAKLERNESFFIHLMENQIVRNGKLRASGPFYSALDFGFLAGVFTTICYVNFMSFQKKIRRVISFAGVTVGLLACYVSCVRTSFVIFVLGVIYHSLISNCIMVSRKKHIIILVSSAVLMFIGLGLFEMYIDSSAISRLRQIYLVISSFSPIGQGLSVRHFDSAFLFFINSMGFLSIPLILFMFYIFLPRINSTIEMNNIYFEVLYLSSLSLLFIMFFQFTIGSYVYNSIPILMACYLTTKKYEHA